MAAPSFTQEDLEKFNPLLKKMKERHEKMKQSRGVPNDPTQLMQVQKDIQKAYDLLTLPDETLRAARPSLANRYVSFLEKLKTDRDALLKATTCKKAALPLKQFQGKSKMALAFLKILDTDIDRPLFDRLVNHKFPLPGKDKSL